MVVTTADPYALLLQRTLFHSPPLYPLFQHYIGSQVWNPLLSPLPPLTLSLHRRNNIRHNVSSDAKCFLPRPPLVVCYRHP